MKSQLSVCPPLFPSLSVCLGRSTCMFVHARVRNRRFRGCCVQYRLAGGCQNGPISCVSSKIGPNTAEMHGTLRLFTALTQCVSGGSAKSTEPLCAAPYPWKDALARKRHRRRKTKSKSPLLKTGLSLFVECLQKNEKPVDALDPPPPCVRVCCVQYGCCVLLVSLHPPPVYWSVALSASMTTTTLSTCSGGPAR